MHIHYLRSIDDNASLTNFTLMVMGIIAKPGRNRPHLLLVYPSTRVPTLLPPVEYLLTFYFTIPSLGNFMIISSPSVILRRYFKHHSNAIGATPPVTVMDTSDVPTVDAFIRVTTSTGKKYSHTISPGQKIVHDICILTALEMQRIVKSGVTKHVFFFNKYYLEWDPTPMDCMEERLVETNIEEYRRDCLPQHWQEKAPYSCS